jgi:ATP/ADP translocase
MQNWLERLFQIPVAEQGKTALVLGYIFLTASACVVGRTAADTLFLSRVGPDQLAWMYLVSALVVAVAAALFARLARGVTLRSLIAVTHIVLAAASYVFRWVLTDYHHHLYIIAPIYLLSEVQGAMAAILFATVLNELFRGSDAQGVFGIAGVGSTLAGIVFGGLMALESDDVPVANLLYVMAVLHAAALLGVAAFRPARDADATSAAPDREVLPTPVDAEVNAALAADFDSRPEEEAAVPPRYQRWLVGLAIVQFPAITLVSFQWKIAVHDAFHYSEDAMAAYFGGYYAVVNVITMMLQITLAGRLLKRFGLLPALLSFPLALGLAAGAMLTASSEKVLLWAATLSKGAESLRRSFSDPAFQLLYGPLPWADRRQLIAAIGGGVKPLVEALAAMAILEVTFLSGARDISYIVAALVFMWVVLAVGCRHHYREAVCIRTSR